MTQNRLRQVLGLGFGLAVIIGNTIGAGILRTPGEVAAHLPGVYWLMLVWIIGGLYALLGAFSIAELGAMLPQSGGQYVYAKRALGNYAGFVVGWSDWLSTCGTVALVAIVIGEYASAFWSVLAGRASSIAVIVVLFFAALQWRGINWGSGAQNLTSLLKALAFVANYALSFVSIFVLRRTEAATTRPYRAWGYPFTTGLALVGSLAFLVGAVMSDTTNSVAALILLAASYPAFLLTTRLRRA